MKKITLLLMLLTVSIGFGQDPTVDPTTPPARNAEDVISIFSAEYSDVANVDYNPNWGQSGFGAANLALDTGSGNLVLAYYNFNYQGIDFNGIQDISGMDFLHVDIWTVGVAPNIYVISSGTEIANPIPNVSGSWQSIDIPIAGITGDPSVAYQIKFDGGDAFNAIYVDNIYFWKNPTAAGSDATLSDLQVDNSTISGFNPNLLNYNINLPTGTTVIPQITTATSTDPAATSVTINQAPALPGDATVVVVSQNETVTKTYTISFATSGPSTPAPTPIDRNAWDVISFYSNTYTDISVSEWSTVWDSASIEDVIIDNNDTKKITYSDFLAVDFSTNSFDATEMERFHIDYFVDEPVTGGEVFIPKISNHTGGTVETNALLYTEIVTASGTWVSIDIPFSDFTGQITPPNGTDGDARENISQLILGTGATIETLYVDNIYIYRAPTALSVEDFTAAKFKVFPNPTANNWNVVSNTTISAITIYDILGKKISSLTPNASEVEINSSAMNTGLYFAKIVSDNGSKTVKLIKE